jgi:hypothetical protein
MSDIRLGTIDFVTTVDSHTAFWRGAADTEATLLCSVKTSAVADPEIRDKFHALAGAVRTSGPQHDVLDYFEHGGRNFQRHDLLHVFTQQMIFISVVIAHG